MLLATLACATSIAAFAAVPSALERALLGCSEEADAGTRLRCFDRVARGLSADPERAFGTETLPGDADRRSPEPKALHARITRVERRPLGEQTFHLDNGQIWTELSAGRARYRTGLPVRIERTTTGGYMLATSSGRATRVRRLE